MLGRGRPLRRSDEELVARRIAHSRAIGIDLRLDTEETAVERIVVPQIRKQKDFARYLF